ncbi:Telomerase protein component 1 [Neurospora sp. IMI 360204]|nr:Telomerase protein component 1 [Neurospora sp. IMI 360204]
MGSRASSLMRKISVRKSKDHKEKELEKKKSALSGSSATSSDGSIPKLGETTAGNNKAGKAGKANGGKAKTIAMPEASQVTKIPSTEQNTVSESTSNLTPIRSKTSTESAPKQQKPVLAEESEPGGQAVIFKPKNPIIVPNSDINIDIERRSRASASLGLTMVTSVGHVWFNAFFEGNGPEQDGKADESGVFEIEWDKLDGIKGSSRKGTRALDRLSVVWRVAGTGTGAGAATEAAAADDAPVSKGGEQITAGAAATAAAAPETAQGVTVITQPGEKSPVPQMKPADWKGVGPEHLPKEKELGLRAETTESASVSKASSLKDLDVTEGGLEANGKGGDDGRDDESLAGVKTSDPKGEELDEVATLKASV